MREFKVIIVGGGPAGVSLGYNLLKKGVDCCIIDKSKFPRKKLCGGLLTEKTVELLNEIYGNKFNSYKYKTRQLSLFLDYKKIENIVSNNDFYLVDRYDFDNYLLNRYKKLGGIVFEDSKIKNINTQKSILELNCGQLLKYDYLVGADGANSYIRRFVDKKYKPNGFCVEVNLGLKNDNCDLQIHFGQIARGYGWVFPKQEITTIGYGGTLSLNMDMIKNFNDFVKKSTNTNNHEKIIGAYIPYGTYVEKPVKNNIFLIGDAAGFVDPITGEGIYFALLSGKMLADSLQDNVQQTEKTYICKISYIQKIIREASYAKKTFYNPIFLKLVLRLIKGHKTPIIYICDNVISHYNSSYKHIIKNYFKDRKKYHE